ncbi:hypothetical protein DMH03_05820 [Amycolatopsis sp. WAC 01376]|nr:hypothetical protein DMH03_05820 [Amycolatopsis sp. WAC 01376]
MLTGAPSLPSSSCVQRPGQKCAHFGLLPWKPAPVTATTSGTSLCLRWIARHAISMALMISLPVFVMSASLRRGLLKQT